MDKLVNSYLTYLRDEQGRSANTIASYQRDLTQAVDFFTTQGVASWSAVDQYVILALVASLKDKQRSAATINRLLSVLRQFYRYLVRHHQLQFNPMELIDNEQVTTSKQPVILSEAEVDRLLGLPANDPLAKRDHALVALMAATGMRVSEIVDLQLADLHLDVHMIRLGTATKRERLVPVSDGAVQALSNYLADTRPGLVNADEQAVFVNAHGRHLTRQGIWKNLKELVVAAGISKSVTPQTLRYSFAVHLLRNGADTRLLQEMFGYSEMRALKPYLKMTAQELSADYERHQPWK